MAGEGYDDGSTRGGKWGCAVAAVVGTPIFAFLLLVDALGDCAPDTACHKGFLVHVLLPTVAIAGGLGLIVRYCVNRLLQSR
jgi:hypothetical protein